MQHSDPVQARLMLWFMAVDEATRNLNLARRALQARETAAHKAKEAERANLWKTYLRDECGYVEGKGLKYSDVKEFDTRNPREFGWTGDLFAISDSCRMLAVILFCQIFKPGNEDPGVVEPNTKQFVSEHLEVLLRVVAPTESEKKSFSSLRKLLETARDKMLGHADAKAFEVSRHPSGLQRLNMHVAAIKGIDFGQFEDVAERLRSALHQYLSD